MPRIEALAVIGVILIAGSAHAEPSRLVVVNGSQQLAAAIETTLVPWKIGVIGVTETSPGAAMPVSGERAREIAQQHAARAVVWVSAIADQHALWVYDADQDRVVARKLTSGPPFDEPTAASVALSIKTLLRLSRVAPPSQRFGARPQPDTTAAPREAQTPQLQFEASAGGRARNTRVAELEPRIGLGLTWTPPALGSWLGLGVHVRTGPGTSVEESELRGHFSDTALRIGAFARLLRRPRFEVLAHVGATGHLTRLTGALPESDEDVDVVRVNPSLDAAAQVSVRLGAGLRVGAGLELSYGARRQRYLVRGVEVLELPPAELGVLVFVGLPFY